MQASVPGSTAIDADLVGRFKQALDRLNPEGGKIGLAVSGGPDSMAMLLLAQEAIPGGFEVATVDHGLRPEAKDECALVVAACKERGVPCEVLTVEVGAGNVQAKAREARYDALGLWAVKRDLVACATAHHADDQAETLLMRLNRGSGVAGLAGVREAFSTEHNVLLVIRPLLSFRRTELHRVIVSAGVDVAQDSSNEDDKYDRSRLRKAMAEADWIDPLALSRSAQHLADANDALEFCVDAIWEGDVSRDGDSLLIPVTGTRAILLRLLERGLCEMGREARGSEVATFLSRLSRRERANLAGTMGEIVERKERWFIILRPEPPRKTG